MSYDSIITEIGGFGWWQCAIMVALFTPDITVAFALLLPVFTGATPPFDCAEEPQQNDNTTTVYRNTDDDLVQINDTAAGETICDRCKQFQFSGDFTSIVSEWSLVCKSDYVSDLITTIQMSGLLIGAGLLGQISDSFGRRKSYFLVIIILSVSGAVSGLSPNWKVFALMRFLVGVGSGGYFCVNCVYPLEFIGAKWRTLCGTIGFWAIGEMLLGLIAYFLRNWRYLTILTSLSGLCCFAFLWIVPESPRWLAQRGRVAEAKRIFANIAKRNRRTVPDMTSLELEYQNLLREREMSKKQKTYTYLDLFKSKMALQTVVVLIAWLTVFLAYYELSYNLKNLSGNRYLNILYAGIVDLFAMILVISLNNKLGRRNLQALLLATAVITNVCMLTLYLLGKDDDLAKLYKVCALAGKSAALANTYVVQILTAEMYPTCIRNLGCGAGQVAGRIGALCAPQILYLGTKYRLVPFLLIIFLCALMLPLTYTLPETNGRPLKDRIHEDNRPLAKENEDDDEETIAKL